MSPTLMASSARRRLSCARAEGAKVKQRKNIDAAAEATRRIAASMRESFDVRIFMPAAFCRREDDDEGWK